MNIKPFFRWFDLWIGAYIDVDNRAIYICPVPMFGVKIQLAPKPKSTLRIYKIIRRNEDYTYAKDKDGKLVVYPTNHYAGDEFLDQDTGFL